MGSQRGVDVEGSPAELDGPIEPRRPRLVLDGTLDDLEIGGVKCKQPRYRYPVAGRTFRLPGDEAPDMARKHLTLRERADAGSSFAKRAVDPKQVAARRAQVDAWIKDYGKDAEGFRWSK
jgi:hypothetical protein